MEKSDIGVEDVSLYPPMQMPKLYITRDELEHGLFNEDQLSRLRASMISAGEMTLEHRNRMRDSFKQINQQALAQIATGNIRYASQLATEEINRRRTNGAT